MSEESIISTLWVALIHSPVLNREREVITTSITNLDVHDIARAARTYAIRGYFVVTPIERQRALAQRIVEHWCDGYGSKRVPERGEALRLVRTAHDLEQVTKSILDENGVTPQIVATCARQGRETLGFQELRARLQDKSPTLLLLGTGWGLADEVFQEVDEILEPISADRGDYNHLSVRSAASIMFDRLLGKHQ